LAGAVLHDKSGGKWNSLIWRNLHNRRVESGNNFKVNHSRSVRAAKKEEHTMMKEDTASKTARKNFDETLTTGAEIGRGVLNGFGSALENVRDLNLKLIDMARANTNAAFDFAREIAEAQAPSDLVQAWTTHAFKQFDVLTKQASELTTLGGRQ
jgi:hypothetical protein